MLQSFLNGSGRQHPAIQRVAYPLAAKGIYQGCCITCQQEVVAGKRLALYGQWQPPSLYLALHGSIRKSRPYLWIVLYGVQHLLSQVYLLFPYPLRKYPYTYISHTIGQWEYPQIARQHFRQKVKLYEVIGMHPRYTGIIGPQAHRIGFRSHIIIEELFAHYALIAIRAYDHRCGEFIGLAAGLHIHSYLAWSRHNITYRRTLEDGAVR